MSRQSRALSAFFGGQPSCCGFRLSQVALGRPTNFSLLASIQRRTRQPTCCPAGSGWTGQPRWAKTRQRFWDQRSNCCVDSAPRIRRRVSVRCSRECPSWSGRRTPVPTLDRRTVGELLADSDSLARETLLDLSAGQSAAMVRTFGRVVDAAARLWAVLPSAVPTRRSEPDLTPRLPQMAAGIAATTSAGHWPGPGPTDDRLLQIAHNLSRARILVERYGGDVQPTTADVRGDIAAARARIMHTLYVAAHGTAVAIIEHTKDLQEQLRIDIRRRRPVAQRPSVHESKAAQALSIRFRVFEQLVGRYVAGHPVTPAALGEMRPVPPASRLQSVLAGWDIQAHRTLLANPDAADLVRVSRIQALIASATAVVSEAAANQGIVDRQVAQRVIPFLDETQVAWTSVARRWAELTSPESRVDPLLVRAASQVRATVAATASNPTGWATPDEIAGRVDLPRTMNALHLNMVSTVDVAHVTRDIAATTPTLTAPARQIAMRAQGEAEIAADQGNTAYEGKTWATERQIATNQVIPLPTPARLGLIKATDHLIASCGSAVAAAAPLDPSESAQAMRPAARAPATRRSHHHVPTMPQHESAPRGPQR